MAYILSVVLFIVQILFSIYISRISKPLREINKKIKDEIEVYLEKQEKKYDLASPNLIRIRLLSIFSSIKNDKEKDEIREYLKKIVRRNNGKPKKLLLLNLSTIFFSLICLYTLLLFVHSEPFIYLSYLVDILVILIWISRKRWIFSILFGVFGFFAYRFIPAHIMLWVGLNLVVGIIALHKKK
ncbi:hypothetical protein AAGG74_14560 [Bacillus mexicanus]|uniref:hypothetical protein n=1 Tax=Bacillus mexicanus TaxID=2834415 RepID=UPI003D24C05A